MSTIKETQLLNAESMPKKSESLSLTIHTGGKNSVKIRNKMVFINKVKLEEEQSQIPTTYELFSDTMNVGFRSKEPNLITKKIEPPIGGGGDGGNGMEKRLEKLEQKTDQIQNKVHELDVKLVGIEEIRKTMLTKSDFLEAIANLPKEDNIKQIVSSSIEGKKLATELYVESVIVKNVNKVIIWLVGTAIATGALVVGVLRLLN